MALAKEVLHQKHRAFADAYLSNGGNAYRAALTAGYKDSFARAKSYKLLDREDVQAYITQRRQQMAKRAVSPERVLLELAAIGFANATDVVQIKMADKLKALELMGRNLGMWEKDNREGIQEGVTIVDDIPE